MNVSVLYDAKLGAREQFGLKTDSDLLEFIGNNGLQDLMYVNTESWRNNPRKDKGVLIDAYKFRSNRKIGYIAFMKGVKGNFVIKSFHLDNDKLTLKDIGNNPENFLR
uniref:Phage-Barnase-EndoU-ColicinE5/D-RelE like nuclease 3 domain-containing protein n=1 Tax=uncultured bacterium contig00010 TaxID=1181502 RepID=A0A806JXV6_9BACT|nr:hypothetical protein [uncultured bacterium contig00010]